MLAERALTAWWARSDVASWHRVGPDGRRCLCGALIGEGFSRSDVEMAATLAQVLANLPAARMARVHAATSTPTSAAAESNSNRSTAYASPSPSEQPTLTPSRGQRRINAAIDRLEWRSLAGEFPMAPALAIQAAIRNLRLPKVSAVAISNKCAPYGLYGIECAFTNGRARVYIIDRGSDLMPVASDFPVTA